MRTLYHSNRRNHTNPKESDTFEASISRKDALRGLGVAAAGLLAGTALTASMSGASPALAAEAGRDNFWDGATVLDGFVDDPGNWDYVLTSCEFKSGATCVHTDESMVMGGVKYRNGVAIIKGDGTYTLKFAPGTRYGGFSTMLGNFDDACTGETHFSFYVDDDFIDDCVIGPNEAPKFFAIPIAAVNEVKIKVDIQKGTNAGLGEMRVHENLDFLAGAASHRITSGLPEGLVLPDGDYEASAVDEGVPVQIKVSVANNLITSLAIESDTGTTSVAALMSAFETILREYGVVSEEPVGGAIVGTLVG